MGREGKSVKGEVLELVMYYKPAEPGGVEVLIQEALCWFQDP
jgi:hypothetical protein